jgi:hypothetical protein
MEDSIFHDYPDVWNQPVNPAKEQTDKLVSDWNAALAVGLLRAADFAYGSWEHMKREGNVGRDQEPRPGLKLWYEGRAFKGIFPARNADGKFATAPNKDMATPGIGLVSRPWMDLIVEYRATKYADVPLFIERAYSDEEAQRMEIGPGPNEEPPIGYITGNGNPSMPPDIGFRVESGKLQWFRISEFRVLYKPTVVSIPASSEPAFVTLKRIRDAQDPSKSFEEQLEAVKMVLGIGTPPPRPPQFAG